MSSSIEKSVPESCMPVLDGLEVSSLVDAIGPIESCVYQIHVELLLKKIYLQFNNAHM